MGEALTQDEGRARRAAGAQGPGQAGRGRARDRRRLGRGHELDRRGGRRRHEDGSGVTGGLVVTPTDAAAAEKLFNQLKAFVQLGGAAGRAQRQGRDLQRRDDHDDRPRRPRRHARRADRWHDPARRPHDLVRRHGQGRRARLRHRLHQGRHRHGGGRTLARVHATASRRRSPQAGASNSSLVWLDITGVRGLVEAMVPDLGGYGANVKPYLEAFDTVIGTIVPGDEHRRRYPHHPRQGRLTRRDPPSTNQRAQSRGPGPRARQRRSTAPHGRSHPPDPCRGDQAADLPAGRRRQPLRP